MDSFIMCPNSDANYEMRLNFCSDYAEYSLFAILCEKRILHQVTVAI